MSSLEDLHFQRFIITQVDPTVDFRELTAPEQVQGAFEAAVYQLLWQHQKRRLGEHGTEFAESVKKPEPDRIDLVADKAIEQSAPIIDNLLAPIAQLVEESTSFESVRDRIFDLYSTIDTSDFAELMGQAMMLSEAAGRWEVLEETGEEFEFAMEVFGEELFHPKTSEESKSRIPIKEPELLAAIRRILSKYYTDGIDAIPVAFVDEEDNIQGLFLDYINDRLTKRLAFSITDSDASFRLLNPDALEQASFNEVDIIDFAFPKNCKKGIACGNGCIAASKTCRKSLTPAQTQTKQAIVSRAKGKSAAANTPPAASAPTTPVRLTTSKKTAATTATPTASVAVSPIKTNSTELDNSRADLVKRLGQKTVDDAEKNVHRILGDKDTNVYVRVGSSATLEKILGDRFRTSAELGVDTHQIPHLKDGYQKARNRVEAKTLGYDEKNTNAEDRPIYGYLGGKDLDGVSHADPATAYGSITLKLRSEVKDRATFTGSDSFKSGVASEVINQGTPPPPNAASLVSTTRHGYDRDKLPSHYPSFYADKSGDKGQLTAAARAKTIDDLAPALATTGNKYVEAQIHGKVTPQDIAEIHFNPTKIDDRPTAAVAKWAKDNNIDLYVSGKKVDPDDIINAPSKSNKSKRLSDLGDALDKGDFDTVSKLADDIQADAQKLQNHLAPGESDHVLKQLYVDSGYDNLPQVTTEAEVTQAWRDGGTLMVRGVATDKQDRTKFLKQFQTGDYFVGNGIYGNGTYVGHAGNIVNGSFVPYSAKSEAKDAKKAFSNVAKHNYINSKNVTFRMALHKDATVVTSSELEKIRDDLDTKLNTWAHHERDKITSSAPKVTAKDVTQYQQALAQHRSSYDAPNPTISVLSTRQDGGIGTEETQTWEFPVRNQGKPLRVNVVVDKSEFSNYHTYNVKDDQGNTLFSTDALSDKKLDNDTIKEIFDGITQHNTLTQLKLESPPIVGDVKLNKATQQKLDTFNSRYTRTRAVLGVEDESDSSGAISRLAVIKGIDAVALEQSYEPDTFMNLLNRSKVLIQQNELKYSQGKKTGAL